MRIVRIGFVRIISIIGIGLIRIIFIVRIGLVRVISVIKVRFVFVFPVCIIALGGFCIFPEKAVYRITDQCQNPYDGSRQGDQYRSAQQMGRRFCIGFLV